MTDRSLSDLVQQAEQLSSYMDEGAEELPRVGRSLNQILHSAQNMFAPASSTPSGTHDAQASILLGSRGLDILHMSHRLEALSSARTLEPLTPASDTDIATFLKNERQNAIIMSIEDTRHQTHAEVEHLFFEEQKSKWEQAKQKFMAAFSNVNADNLNITLQPQEGLTGALSYSSRYSNMNVEEAAYAKVITNYNEEILKGGIRPNLAYYLSETAKTMEDQGIVDLWKVVCSITEVPIGIEAESSNPRSSSKVQTALIHQAKAHLEKSYMRHIQSLVYSQLERAHLGGVPGLVPLVKGYLSVILPTNSIAHLEDGEAKGVPVWPLIFYCLRAGGVKAAASAAQENSNPSVAEVVSALDCLSKSDSGQLPLELQKKLRVSYKRSAKSITDPFKRAVYCLLAHSDVEDDHTDIIVTTDDYLWLKLSLVDCGDTSTTGSSTGGGAKGGKSDTLTLGQLQNLLYVQYGEKHFNAWQQPLLYMSVLLLTGQFEGAIEFLSRVEKLRCHAIHIALVLHEANLLALPSQSNAPMLSSEEGDPEGFQRLNLAHLIRLYIKKFENANPLEALHYCFFLRYLKGTSQNKFNDCICDLALQTREFDLLLGTLNNDGTRTPGIVDKFKVDVYEIADVVAKDSEGRGLHEDSIKLYDLAKNHPKSLTLLNQLLSQVVHLPGTTSGADGASGNKRGRCVDLASAIALRFKTHGHSAPLTSIGTLHLLLDLSTFFDLHHQDKHNEAIEVLKRLQIIALSRNEVEPRVSALSSLGMDVKATFPHVLLAAMTSTYNLYKTLLGPSASSPARATSSPLSKLNTSLMNVSSHVSPLVKHLKEQARAIVTFAGMIPMRLNADVNARLVQLEALVN